MCDVENWPDSERKPSVYVLCLPDLADHESLPRALVLAEARDLSPRVAARPGDVLEATGR